jgi:hypothetical protein
LQPARTPRCKHQVPQSCIGDRRSTLHRRQRFSPAGCSPYTFRQPLARAAARVTGWLATTARGASVSRVSSAGTAQRRSQRTVSTVPRPPTFQRSSPEGLPNAMRCRMQHPVHALPRTSWLAALTSHGQAAASVLYVRLAPEVATEAPGVRRRGSSRVHMLECIMCTRIHSLLVYRRGSGDR